MTKQTVFFNDDNANAAATIAGMREDYEKYGIDCSIDRPDNVSDLWECSQMQYTGGQRYLLAASLTKAKSASSDVTSVTAVPTVATLPGGDTTVDAGVFSFPFIGMYRVDFSAYHNLGQSNNFTIQYYINETSDNGTSWSNLLQSKDMIKENRQHFVEYFNCTDISNDKLRFYFDYGTNLNTVDDIQIIFQKLN